jgi:hypothetical protein
MHVNDSLNKSTKKESGAITEFTTKTAVEKSLLNSACSSLTLEKAGRYILPNTEQRYVGEFEMIPAMLAIPVAVRPRLIPMMTGDIESFIIEIYVESCIEKPEDS